MIYTKIKNCCALKGISINQLEQDLSLARGSLCKIDKHVPSSEKINAIAEYLGVTPDYLLNEEKKEFIMPKYEPKQFELILEFSLFDRKTQDAIIEFMKIINTTKKDDLLVDTQNNTFMLKTIIENESSMFISASKYFIDLFEQGMDSNSEKSFASCEDVDGSMTYELSEDILSDLIDFLKKVIEFTTFLKDKNK